MNDPTSEHKRQHQVSDHHVKNPTPHTKQPSLRGATINPVHGANTTGQRPRAGTIGRKDAVHSMTATRDRHKDQDKHSTVSGEHHRPPVMYENTFKMEPDLKYRESDVSKIIRAVLNDHIQDNSYNSAEMKLTSLVLSDRILEQIKTLEMKRYKFVCFVMLGETNNQSMQFVSRCLWDQRFDSYSTVHVTHGNIHATGTVYAVYVE